MVGPDPRGGVGSHCRPDFHLGYSPERIDPGNTDLDFANTPKVVSGVDAELAGGGQAFYDRLVDRTVPVSGTREAELTKLLENTFRHVNIALVNEIGRVRRGDGHRCLGGHRRRVDQAVRLPPGSRPARASEVTACPSIPATCRGRCAAVSASRSGSSSWPTMSTSTCPTTSVQTHRALNRDKRSVNGSRVLLLGLSYKRNTGDTRESPGMVIAQILSSLGADVRVADPHLAPGATGLPQVELTCGRGGAGGRGGGGDGSR